MENYEISCFKKASTAKLIPLIRLRFLGTVSISKRLSKRMPTKISINTIQASKFWYRVAILRHVRFPLWSLPWSVVKEEVFHRPSESPRVFLHHTDVPSEDTNRQRFYKPTWPAQLDYLGVLCGYWSSIGMDPWRSRFVFGSFVCKRGGPCRNRLFIPSGRGRLCR